MSWKTLPLANLPRLLIQTHFDHAGYKVQLTDLSRIWSDTLTTKEITLQAEEQRCSIDASDPDNRQHLFHKIQSAFQGDEDTTLNIYSQDGATLRIDVTAPLPRPLAPLRWSLRLTRQPDSAMATNLVNPLLLQARNLQNQIQSLIELLGAKDKVISKITDRFEASGNDISVVFPGASNSKIRRSTNSSQRAQLASYVKGLGDFDKEAWRQQTEATSQAGSLNKKEIEALLEDLPTSSGVAPDGDAAAWWEQLGSPGSASRASRNTTPAVPNQRSRSAVSYEDEFEKQTTPTRLRGLDEDGDVDMTELEPRKTGATQGHDDSSTEDEDLDAPATRKTSQARPASSHRAQNIPRPSDMEQHTSLAVQSKLRFGAFGGKHKTPQPDSDAETEISRTTPQPAAAPASPAKPRFGKIGGKTQARPSASPPPDPQASFRTTKPKLRMGTFGGKSKLDVPAPADSGTGGASPVKAGTTPTGDGRTPAAKASSSAGTTPDPASRGRTPEVKLPSPVRETSEERRARRREELKKMETGASKGPVKKKRKF